MIAIHERSVVQFVLQKPKKMNKSDVSLFNYLSSFISRNQMTRFCLSTKQTPFLNLHAILYMYTFIMLIVRIILSTYCVLVPRL